MATVLAHIERPPVNLNAPSTLQIQIQTPKQSRRMGIYAMEYEDMPALLKAKPINVRVHTSKSPEYAGRLGMRALTAFIPAVARGLRKHNHIHGEVRISDTVFPQNNTRVVTKILGWIRSCLNGSDILPFHYLKLDQYRDVLKISQELSIGYLITRMTKKIAIITRSSPSDGITSQDSILIEKDSIAGGKGDVVSNAVVREKVGAGKVADAEISLIEV